MSGRKKPKTPERDQTDTSLRDERAKTDAELAQRRAAVEEDADAVIESAQDRADRVLAAARAKADRKLERSGAAAKERAAVAEERSAEDVALEKERTVASERVHVEREEGAKILEELLHLEREKTDLNLRVERERSDAALASRDEFLGMVSHDLRTLLGGIALSAAVVLRDAGENSAHDSCRREAQRTQRYTARMNRLIGDLLDVVSIEAGKLHVVPANDDAAQIVREILETFQPLAAANGSALAAHVSDDSVLARIDRERIIQVLANLISNAIKFTEHGDRIDLVVQKVGDSVEFKVRDTGCGIAAEDLPLIFNRFAQVRSDRRGLGLGLYISRCIVEAHGGRLSVESTVGEGSTFTFTVPAARPTRPTPS